MFRVMDSNTGKGNNIVVELHAVKCRMSASGARRVKERDISGIVADKNIANGAKLR